MNVLRKLRMQARLSIAGLAEKSEVSPTTISLLERGRQPAIPRTIQRLADALGVEYEALAELETQASPKHPAALAA